MGGWGEGERGRGGDGDVPLFLRAADGNESDKIESKPMSSYVCWLITWNGISSKL
ncbi:MAG: hypothetical protein F6K58_14930 [Symploca sp. SIO2E9]|nr:hypothetical protein [Symploca sp. SIO2E9]